MQDRARRFCAWLSERAERHIAVVSHADFLYELCSLFCHDCPGGVRNHLRYDWRNAEMRSLVLRRPLPAA